MEWVAFAIVALGTTYFAVHYRGFRRGLLFALVGLIALVVVCGAFIWLENEQYSQEHRDPREVPILRTLNACQNVGTAAFRSIPGTGPTAARPGHSRACRQGE